MKQIKHLLITIAVLLCSATVHAYDFEVDGIYYNIVSLTDLTAKVTDGDYKYSGEIIIPSTITYKSKSLRVTEIGYGAFENCYNLTSIEIPNSVTKIASSAFDGCSGLTSVIIGNSVTSIDNYAFYNCSGLTSVVIPNTVTSIGMCAFDGCTGLTSVVVGNSVTSIGVSAFTDCTSLKNISIGNSVISIGAGAFRRCSKLTSIIIPSSVTTIGESAFFGCYNLNELIIEDGESELTISFNYYSNGDVKAALFNDCNNIKTVYLGRNLDYNFDVPPPFENIKSLKSLTIGKNVKSLSNPWDGHFYGCSGLTSIYLLGTNPPNGNGNFTNNHYINTTIYVPQGSLSVYQSSDVWKNFWDIREMSTTETPEEEVKKCATPVITYNDNGLDITTETDGAEIHTDITCSDANSYNGDRIDLSATYSITTYATKSGYLNSDTATATLCWIAVSGSSEENSIIEVEAMPVLITCNNGTINIRGGKDGAEVVVYTTSGVAVGNATITNGNASISTELAMGEIVVVNIAGKGIKIVMQ